MMAYTPPPTATVSTIQCSSPTETAIRRPCPRESAAKSRRSVGIPTPSTERPADALFDRIPAAEQAEQSIAPAVPQPLQHLLDCPQRTLKLLDLALPPSNLILQSSDLAAQMSRFRARLGKLRV